MMRQKLKKNNYLHIFNMEDIFANMSNEELIEYAQSIEADAYLSTIEAHEEAFADCGL